MKPQKYKLKYLPIFEEDLLATISHISLILNNKKAATDLLNMIEIAILERLNCPLAFEPYPSYAKRKYPYYRIYVKNCTIYYVVINDVVEIRRLIHNKRNIKNLLK